MREADEMSKEEIEIKEMVDRETRGWDTKDAELLTTLFHPDMVWPWPRTFQSHDPMDWIFVLGRFDKNRWMKNWQELFDSHELARNIRKIRKIVVSEEKDGAFAVVDIDTLWVARDGTPNYWQGRVCKVYAKVGREWKMTMHTGVLQY
jgi:ketosteroid isomerase-like protein